MIRRFVKKYILNNFWYKLLAVIFAFVLWLVVLNVTDPEYTRTISGIQVQIQNENMVLDGTHEYTVESGATIKVTITGKRSVISTMTHSDFLARANFAELSITNAAPITVTLTGTKQRYSSQVTIVPNETSMIINVIDLEAEEETEEETEEAVQNAGVKG